MLVIRIKKITSKYRKNVFLRIKNQIHISFFFDFENEYKNIMKLS